MNDASLKPVVLACLAFIDSVPASMPLPSMPGFDRDWVDRFIAGEPQEDDSALSYAQVLEMTLEWIGEIPEEQLRDLVQFDQLGAEEALLKYEMERTGLPPIPGPFYTTELQMPDLVLPEPTLAKVLLLHLTDFYADHHAVIIASLYMKAHHKEMRKQPQTDPFRIRPRLLRGVKVTSAESFGEEDADDDRSCSLHEILSELYAGAFGPEAPQRVADYERMLLEAVAAKVA